MSKLEETVRLETQQLKVAMSSLDSEQFAALAASLCEDRLKLAKRVDELQSLVREDHRRIPTDPGTPAC
jgi:hypothetical protein